MLRDIPWKIITIFLGVIFSGFVALYFLGDYEQNAINQAITETVESTIIANVDNSSRLRESELYLDKEGFETDFESRISENINLAEGIEDINYDYLETDDGGFKAVKVRMKIKEETYQATYKVNFSTL